MDLWHQKKLEETEKITPSSSLSRFFRISTVFSKVGIDACQKQRTREDEKFDSSSFALPELKTYRSQLQQFSRYY